jgi:predicted alpha-1,2-mannosidase
MELSLRAKVLSFVVVLGLTAVPDRAQPTPAPSGPTDIGRLQYVSTLTGTDDNFGFSHGSTLPLVSMPWGMINWCPKSVNDGWIFVPNGKINAFRATHEPSPWMGDYGVVDIMPQTDELKTAPDEMTSDYDQSTAVFRPDYCKLDIQNGPISAELTSSQRCAVFRFTYPGGNTGRIVINAFEKGEITFDGREIRVISRRNSGGVHNPFGEYFVMKLDRDTTNTATTTAHVGRGDATVGYVEFATNLGEPVNLTVGTSFISFEQAEQNLKAETDGGFDGVHARAIKAWNDNLSKIDVEGTDEQKKTFYGCMYRAAMFPHRLYELDASGKQIHMSPYDGQVHDGPLYGDIGIWDGFRTTFPFITLMNPDQTNEILQGFVNAAHEGHLLQEWPSPGGRGGMGGQHSTAVFADAIVKGLTGFDREGAFQSMYKSASPEQNGEAKRNHLDDFLKYGYVPGAVSETLDDSYDDWCIAQAAKALGHDDAVPNLLTRSENYKNIWDSSNGFMRTKQQDGSWKFEPFDEFAWGRGFTESGPWQGSWFVPHDPSGLAALIGGRAKFLDKMDQLMASPSTAHPGDYGGLIHEAQEMVKEGMGQYEAGNQPDFDNLYLFAVLGQPWKTEHWTRAVIAKLFNSSVDGYPGDDDNGSMSSWYLFGAMGFYPFCPGTTQFVYTSPVFTKVTLHLPSGKTFTIWAPSNSEDNIYVQKRTLNGVEDTKTYLENSDILNGGTMTLDMGSNPKERTVSEADLPYSETPWSASEP